MELFHVALKVDVQNNPYRHSTGMFNPIFSEDVESHILDQPNSDNIPGLKGVGPKSLLKYFPMMTDDRELSIKELVDHANSIEKPYKVHKLVSENKELLELNYRLMQLKEVDISGSAKMLTLNKVTGDTDRMNVLEFKKMFMVDKMYTVIKDLDSWLASSFNALNAYASL